ncbi:MAG: SDR family NAD(P)-dependent oxidoreductase, partial [Rhizobiaceae bacterium]|nr:SDR family NAD(P)-dependent oxidoreductase [Rhizobiaceae bacterium]
LTYQEACLISVSDEGQGCLLNFDIPGDLEAGTAKLHSLQQTADEGQDWRTHCEATIRKSTFEPQPVGDLKAWQRQHPQQIDPNSYYRALDHLGLNYGPGFRNLKQVFLGAQSALGLVHLNPDLPKLDSPMHPALLDACLHLFPAATGEYGDFGSIEDENTTFLPITVERFAVYRDVPEEVWSLCRARAEDQVAGERYCVDIDIFATDGTPVATLAGLTIKQFSREEFLPIETDNVADWLYGVDWLPCPMDEAAATDKVGHWLVITHNSGEVDGLLQAFEASGQSFDIVSPEQVMDDTVQPPTPDAPVRGVINAMALSSRPLALMTTARLTEETQRQFELSQAMLRLTTETFAAAEIQPKIWYLTRGAQAPVDAALGGEAIQAVLWGHGRAIAQEHPNVWGGLIDIDDETLGTEILAELLAGDVPDREDQIALRQGERFGPRLVRRGFDDHAGPILPPIVPDASYLITGGLGALGLKVGQWLVEEQGARHLWLVSRRKPDAKTQAEISTLEDQGATVHVVSTDIADVQQVDQLVGEINRRGPALDGLFHCAGLLDDGIMIDMDWERYHRVTAAKIEGSWALHQATEKLGLNHFVLFSSILSVIGSMGQLNYVSGNAFLDSLVGYRRRLGLAATAMNWGPFENAGLAVESGERGEAIWRARGTRFIPMDIGLQAMNATLLNRQDHMVVTHTDWSRFVSQFAQPPKLYEKLTDGQSGSNRQLLDDLATTLDQFNAATPSNRRDILQSAIARICTVNLELDEAPDPDMSLREVGLDSLMSITVINDIENVFGVRLPARQLLKGPSINELTQMVLDDLPTGSVAAAATAAAATATVTATSGEDNIEDESEAVVAKINQRTGSWLVVQKPRPDARMRLICFPFAGGGSAVFDAWGEAFDPDIEIVSVEAPGRLGRIDETPVRTIEDFARGLYPELRDKLDRPYAMLGHCLGGLTLYEMLRFFQARRDPMPKHIFVSGARPPSVLRAPGSFEAELNERLGAFDDYRAGRLGHQQSDDVFSEIVRAFGISESSKMLEVEELRQLVLPTVRAEFEMTSRYVYLPERPFNIPITCFRGSRDDYVQRSHADLWEKFTTSRFERFERDTGHFAIVEDFEFIRSIIEDRLLSQNAASA